MAYGSSFIDCTTKLSCAVSSDDLRVFMTRMKGSLAQAMVDMDVVRDIGDVVIRDLRPQDVEGRSEWVFPPSDYVDEVKTVTLWARKGYQCVVFYGVMPLLPSALISGMEVFSVGDVQGLPLDVACGRRYFLDFEEIRATYDMLRSSPQLVEGMIRDKRSFMLLSLLLTSPCILCNGGWRMDYRSAVGCGPVRFVLRGLVAEPAIGVLHAESGMRGAGDASTCVENIT